MNNKPEGLNGFPLDGSQSTQLKYNLFAEKMAMGYESYYRRRAVSSPAATFGLLTATAQIIVSLMVFLLVGIRWTVLRLCKNQG